MLLHSNRFEFGKQKTTVEAETLRLAQGVSTILEGGSRNPETYIRANTAGVSAKFKSGKLSEGYKAAAELYFKAKQLKGTPKDMSLVLTAAIRGLSTHGKVEHAAALLEKMIEQYSLAATSNTVMHLFKNLGYMGKVNEAVALFELMKERNVQLDERMLAGIIHGYAHERKISAASKYFNASTGILADLTRVYGATGDLTNAVKFFNKNENVRGFRQGADMISAAVDAFAFNGELVSAWRQANIGVEKLDLSNSLRLFI
ncbi:hypothetical protein BC829DRAFT_168684 [Chytridium lagenaria]|nr:hypothetical protein BC829DRAFT_168684 [Chytridium lagenaria]